MPKSPKRRQQPRGTRKTKLGGDPAARAAKQDQQRGGGALAEVVALLRRPEGLSLDDPVLAVGAATYAANKTWTLAAECGAPAGELDAIARDIPARADALLARWEQPQEMWPLLAMAHEEAWHYAPASVPLIARAVTVAAVRNSALESAHSARHLPDEALALITGTTAIRMANGLPPLGNPVPDAPLGPRSAPRPLGEDPFAGLADRFPAAWQAFGVLASLQLWDQEAAGLTASPAEHFFGRVKAERVRLEDLAAPGGRASGESWVLDGMAPGVGPSLIATLADHDILACPSIKHLSRNPAVVLAVVEYLLRAGKCLVTANVLIAPGYVGCRGVPRAPDSAAFRKASVLKGLTGEHRRTLKILRS